MQTDTLISAHFGEIALKGRNRSVFEKRLMENIRQQLAGCITSIKKKESRLLLHSETPDIALARLKHVFGIEWFSPSISVERDIDTVVEALKNKRPVLSDTTIKIQSRRSDKYFSLTSPEINRKVGMALEAAGWKIDLEAPEKIVILEVLADCILLSWGKTHGAGGLPYGSSGRLLSLLSGGIDSPVASWQMMRRGCMVEFLHLHAQPSVKNSKIMRLLAAMREYSPVKLRLFAAPYTEFYKRTTQINPKIEFILFRRFMLLLAQKLMAGGNYLGIVTGDSIGQVASQTLENLLVTNEAAKVPVYRPLAGTGKQEIIDLAKQIGTYDISTEQYKDCCSLVAARHPSTRVRPEAVRQAEEDINIAEIVDKTAGQIEIIEI